MLSRKSANHTAFILLVVILCIETVFSTHKNHHQAYKLDPHHPPSAVHNQHHKPLHHGHHKPHHTANNRHAHKPHHYHHRYPPKPVKVYYEKPEPVQLEPTKFCPEPFGTFPIPGGQCTGFYFLCKSYVHILKKCPGRQVFDSKMNRCYFNACWEIEPQPHSD